MIRALSAAVTLALASPALAADWPQHLGPDRNGVSSESLPDRLPADGPKILWTTPVGVGFGGPAIRDGFVYLLDREDDARDVLRCLDVETGKERWRWRYDAPGRLSHNGSRATPTVTEDTVYTVGPFGHVSAVDRETGEPRWTRHLVDDLDGEAGRWGFAQSPLVTDGMVIVQPQGKTTVAALDQKTGETKWTAGGRGGGSYTSPQLVTLAGVRHLLVLTKSGLTGLSVETGEPIWAWDGYQNRIPIPAPTVLPDDRLFVTGGYGSGSVFVKVTRDGDEWSIQPQQRIDNGAQIHPAVLHDGHLYANFNENDNLRGRGGDPPSLVCLDLRGNILWKTGRDPHMDRGPVMLADGKLIAMGGADGRLHIAEASPKGFDPIVSWPAFAGQDGTKSVWAPLALSGGKLVVRNQSVLRCLDLRPADAVKPAPGGGR